MACCLRAQCAGLSRRFRALARERQARVGTDATEGCLARRRRLSGLRLAGLRVDDGVQIRFGGRPATASLEHRSLLDRERHVMDIALDLGRALQRDGLGANGAGDLTAHHHLLTGDQSRDLALFANDHLGGLHITLDLAVDLQDATADDPQSLADDPQIIADT